MKHGKAEAGEPLGDEAGDDDGAVVARWRVVDGPGAELGDHGRLLGGLVGADAALEGDRVVEADERHEATRVDGRDKVSVVALPLVEAVKEKLEPTLEASAGASVADVALMLQ